MKKIIPILLAAALLLCLCSCEEKNDASATKKESETVGTVADYEVRRDLYNYFYENYADQYGTSGEEYESATDEEKSQLEKKLQESTESSLKQFFAVYALAAENGLSPDDEEVKNSVDDYVSALINTEYEGLKASLIKDVKEQHMTYEAFLKIIEATQLQNKLYLKLISDGKIEQDTEVLTEIFLSGEMVRTKHILVGYPDTVSYRDIISDYSKAKANIAETVEKIKGELDAGADFDSLIEKYNTDALMMQNGDGSYFTKGNKDLEYEEAAFALGVGEVSDVVYTREGACFIKRLPLSEDYIDKNLFTLIDAYGEGVFNIMLEEKAATLTFEQTVK